MEHGADVNAQVSRYFTYRHTAFCRHTERINVDDIVSSVIKRRRTWNTDIHTCAYAIARFLQCFSTRKNNYMDVHVAYFFHIFLTYCKKQKAACQDILVASYSRFFTDRAVSILSYLLSSSVTGEH